MQETKNIIIIRSMKKRAVSREESVLKLVHPGGFVEIHKRPVAASDVMRKNPRHCITRPDVFKYPCIVVRPESILKPGNVFYIVPNHTVYRLLQDYETSVGMAMDPRLPDYSKGPTRKNRVRTTLDQTHTQHGYTHMDSNRTPSTQLLKGSHPKKLGMDHPRSDPTPTPTPTHQHRSRSGVKHHQPQPSIKRSPLKSGVKLTKLHVKHRHFDDKDGDDDDDNSLVLLAKWRSMHQNMDKQVTVTPNKQQGKDDKVKLKPCLKKEREKQSKGHGRKVKFFLPNVQEKGETKLRVVDQECQL